MLGGLNAYRYCRSTPLRLVDPTGLIAVPCRFSTKTHLHINFNGCSQNQQRELKNTICQAAQLAWQALDPQNELEYDKWFSEPEKDKFGALLHGELDDCGRIEVDSYLAKTALAFDFRINISCHTDCDNETVAYAYNYYFWQRPPWVNPSIHICPKFWGRDPAKMVGTILHEMTHEACATADHDYVFNDPPVGTGLAPHYHNGPLTPDELVDNASSYQGFYEDLFEMLH
jgi:hypothetical protein